MTTVADRPTAWWLATLRRRAETRTDDVLHLDGDVRFDTDVERRAALKFFNAAYRAEESGLSQAHVLAMFSYRFSDRLTAFGGYRYLKVDFESTREVLRLTAAGPAFGFSWSW